MVATSHPKLVLLADDADALRLAVQTCLIMDGFEVLAAADGRDALRMAADSGRAIDLLIADISMPVMDGFELVSRLRREHPNVPVLVISAHDAKTCRGQLGTGVAFLEKPFSCTMLREKVEALLAVSHQR